MTRCLVTSGAYRCEFAEGHAGEHEACEEARAWCGPVRYHTRAFDNALEYAQDAATTMAQERPMAPETTDTATAETSAEERQREAAARRAALVAASGWRPR